MSEDPKIKENGEHVSSKRSKSTKSISHKKRKQIKGEYEVESIVDYERRKDKDWYLVKWKNWGEQWNSWEPFKHVENSPRLLINFWKEKDAYFQIESILENLDASKCDSVLESLFEPSEESLMQLQQKLLVEYDGVIKFSVIAKKKTFSSLLEKLLYKKLIECQKQLKLNLKIWQDHINKISGDAQPIIIENHVDFEGPPKTFTYINDYIAADGITIPDDPLVGCECSNCLETNDSCCPHQANSVFPYDKFRKLQLNHGTPIYECNKRCKCGPECRNRVVQKGRKAKLCIFRTSNGCGWGVKALEFIRQDSFVTEYVGEVITNEEAEQRGKIYDSDGRTYLFDLDFNDTDNPVYTVDAAHYGNISHFINHSCEPNLAVFAVWINCVDPNLPRIALFADRDIQRGEELTFDYMSQSIASQHASNGDGLDSPIPCSPSLTKRLTTNSDETTAKTECKCGSSKCRKYLF